MRTSAMVSTIKIKKKKKLLVMAIVSKLNEI